MMMTECIPIELSQKTIALADKFAKKQTDPDKAKQVYYNTIAVKVVNSYLRWMEFETDLEASESWNPLTQLFNNSADLVLKNIGSLECRPIWAGQKEISLPIEGRENRIGCLLVKMEEDNRSIQIMGGFLADQKGNLPETIKVAELISPEEFVEELDTLEPLEKIATSEEISVDSVLTAFSSSLQEKLGQIATEKVREIIQELVTVYQNSEIEEHFQTTYNLLKDAINPQYDRYAMLSLGEDEDEPLSEDGGVYDLADELEEERKQYLGLE